MRGIGVALLLGACGGSSSDGQQIDSNIVDTGSSCSPIGTITGTVGGYSFAPLTTATARIHFGAGVCDPFMNCGTVDVSDGVATLVLHFYGTGSPWGFGATFQPPGQSLSSIQGTLSGGGTGCQTWTLHIVFASGTFDGSIVAQTTMY